MRAGLKGCRDQRPGGPELYPGGIIAMREPVAEDHFVGPSKYRSGPATSAGKGLALKSDAAGL